MLAVRGADWPLLTGGRYSEVAVRTGLTVVGIKLINCFFFNCKLFPNRENFNLSKF
jgi:hypothetical protein